MAIVCSAVDTVFPPGVFITKIPLSVAADKLILSTPVPALPIYFKFYACSITLGVTYKIIKFLMIF